MKRDGLNARWIGVAKTKGDRNVTFLARKRFFPPENGHSLVLRIAADSRYILHLNGERLGLGPARSSRTRSFFDTYDLAGHLRAGENFLAVEVHCAVTPTYTAAPVRPALFVQIGDWLRTDATWDVRRDPSRRSDLPLYTFQIGYSEWKDFRLEPKGWKIFADSPEGWTAGKVLAAPHGLGQRRLVERDIPPLQETEYSFQRMVASGAVPQLEPGAETEMSFADRVHGELHFQALLPRVEDQNGELQIAPSRTNRGAFCVLDFERECVGHVLIEIDAPAGTILDLAYGESLQDDRVLARRFRYHMADRYLLKEGRQLIECCLHNRGFRYLQLVLRAFDRGPVIHSVRVLDRRYPLPVRATFHCDDDALNRLWTMCEETISACSLDTFVDCPWREQALWLNDVLVVAPLYLGLTADAALPARCLQLGLDGQSAEGLIPVVPPSEAEWFLSMQALAALILSEYYLFTGDLSFVRQTMPSILRGLDVYRRWQGPDGLIANREDRPNFIDWGYSADVSELEGTTAILNVLIAAAGQSVAGLLDALGDHAEAATRKKEGEAILHAAVKTFWLAEPAGFTDCIGSPSRRPTFSQHPHAVSLFYDLLPEDLQPHALAWLSQEGVVEAELYFQYFVIGALSRHGQEEAALTKIRELWGEMIDTQSPTVWESHGGSDAFEGCGSLCHAFSCAPLAFLQNVLLGIRPLTPGFREFALNPRALDLTWCEGRVPTPQGFIDVSWTKEESGLQVVVEIPSGLTGILPDGIRLESGRHTLSLDVSPEESPQWQATY